MTTYIFKCPECKLVGERTIDAVIVCPHCGATVAIISPDLISTYAKVKST